MQCYSELTPPTAVTHSLSLPFLSASANNLVIAKTSLLQIFTLKSVLSDTLAPTTTSTDLRRTGVNAPGSLTATAQRADRALATKLVLIAQYELSGVVTSLARVKILKSKSGGEALLVSLRNARASLVEWDPERYSIYTISIHLYEPKDREDKDIPGNPWDPDEKDNASYLTVDPRSRCAALKFGERQLAILPFHQQSDDLVMEDYDPDIDGERPEPTTSHAKSGTEDNGGDKTPYGASFVVSMLALDPTLLHPVHLAFLYEYREPTFGVLSSQMASSMSLLPERRDTLSYTVITLDLEQRALTVLLSVNDLPYDMFAVVPLRLPIGGTLLIGGNQIIHVDQAGKTNGVAVNEFAKTSTTLSLADQSDLALRLEDCLIEQLGHESSDLLLILNSGELAIVGFKIDGRSISGLSIRRVPEHDGGFALSAGPSCASLVGRGRMFIGSEDADSVVLGWSRRLDKLKRQKSNLGVGAGVDVDASDLSDLDEDIDDDDDLYASTLADQKLKGDTNIPDASDQSDEYRFRVHDTLENFGPIRTITLGKPSEQLLGSTRGDENAGFELMATSGRGRAGALTTFRRQIDPRVLESHSLPNATRLWSVSVTRPSDGLSTHHSEDFDSYIIASTRNEDVLQSAAYSLKPAGLVNVKDTDFDPDAGMTVEVGTLNNGARIVQVLPTELRCFDAGESYAIPSPRSHSSSTCSVATSQILQRRRHEILACKDCTDVKCVKPLRACSDVMIHARITLSTHNMYLSLKERSIASMKTLYSPAVPRMLLVLDLPPTSSSCLHSVADVTVDFGLAQILPLAEEEDTGAAPEIISASFADPYVLLIRDDESIMVLRADEASELDEIEQGNSLKKKGFRAGYLYEDSNDVFRLESEMEIEDDAGNVLMFLLTVGGGLQVCYP